MDLYSGSDTSVFSASSIHESEYCGFLQEGAMCFSAYLVHKNKAFPEKGKAQGKEKEEKGNQGRKIGGG